MTLAREQFASRGSWSWWTAAAPGIVIGRRRPHVRRLCSRPYVDKPMALYGHARPSPRSAAAPTCDTYTRALPFLPAIGRDAGAPFAHQHAFVAPVSGLFYLLPWLQDHHSNEGRPGICVARDGSSCSGCARSHFS